MNLQIKDDKQKDNKGRLEQLWVICDRSGTVSICSNHAAGLGIIAGVTNVHDLVLREHLPLLDDAFGRIYAGAEVSVTVEGAPATGFDIILVKSAWVMSSVFAQLYFFRNRQEYLAASDAFGDRISKVFCHTGSTAEELLSVIRELEADGDGIDDVRLRRAGELTRRIAGDSAYFGYATGDTRGGEKICDMAVLFNHIAQLTRENGNFPFSVSFENRVDEHSIVCAADTGRVAQIILMLATVSARLSEDRSCILTLSGNDCDVVIEAGCRLKNGYEFYGRSENLGEIYRCIPGNPVELMILESLVYVPEWRAEYVADGKGDFILRARIVAEPNPDSFKFRDSSETVKQVFRRYLDYTDGAFLPDPQKQRKNQKNIAHASSIIGDIGCDEEYYGTDEKLI